MERTKGNASEYFDYDSLSERKWKQTVSRTPIGYSTSFPIRRESDNQIAGISIAGKGPL